MSLCDDGISVIFDIHDDGDIFTVVLLYKSSDEAHLLLSYCIVHLKHLV